MVRILKWRVPVFEMGNFVGKENAQVHSKPETI